jgi:hypothetical protein
LGENALKVVLTQAKSEACAGWIDSPASTATIKSHFIGNPTVVATARSGNI